MHTRPTLGAPMGAFPAEYDRLKNDKFVYVSLVAHDVELYQ